MSITSSPYASTQLHAHNRCSRCAQPMCIYMHTGRTLGYTSRDSTAHTRTKPSWCLYPEGLESIHAFHSSAFLCPSHTPFHQGPGPECHEPDVPLVTSNSSGPNMLHMSTRMSTDMWPAPPPQRAAERGCHIHSHTNQTGMGAGVPGCMQSLAMKEHVHTNKNSRQPAVQQCNPHSRTGRIW